MTEKREDPIFSFLFVAYTANRDNGSRKSFRIPERQKTLLFYIRIGSCHQPCKPMAGNTKRITTGCTRTVKLQAPCSICAEVRKKGNLRRMQHENRQDIARAVRVERSRNNKNPYVCRFHYTRMGSVPPNLSASCFWGFLKSKSVRIPFQSDVQI